MNRKQYSRTPNTHSATMVLLIEDNEDDYVLLEEFLPDEFEIIWCTHADSARKHFADPKLDLILLDHGLPDTNALAFLEEIKSQYPYLPVVVLTGNEDPALAVSALKKGAASYLLKEEIFEHLLPVMRAAIGKRKPPLEVTQFDTPDQSKTRFEDTAKTVYQTLLETMNEGCLLVTVNGLIALANEAVGSMTNMPCDQLLGQNAGSLFDEETAVLILTHLHDLQTAQQPQTNKFEGVLIGRQKHPIPVLISSKSIHGENGRFQDCLLILTDISEQVSAKEAIYELYKNAQEQQGQLTALIESSQDGLVLVTQDLNIPVINRQTCQLLQLPHKADSWRNQTIDTLLKTLNQYTPAAIEAFEQTVTNIQNGTHTSSEGEFEANQHFLQWATRPVTVEDLQLGYLIIFRDVTKEHDIEMLRQELTRTMVHDLRNPISGTRLSLEMIERIEDKSVITPITKRRLKYVQRALDNTHRMQRLVDNILDVSRMESGTIPLNRESISVVDLIEHVLHVQAAVATDKLKALHNQVPTDLPPAWGDVDLIERVLFNLVDNSIKFSQKGDEVFVTAVLHQTPTPEIHISVTDTGPGIPDSLKDTLFNKYTTGNHERHGNGLGLAFCKLAVEAHGGRIWVSNQPENKTTFTFSLPVFFENI